MWIVNVFLPYFFYSFTGVGSSIIIIITGFTRCSIHCIHNFNDDYYDDPYQPQYNSFKINIENFNILVCCYLIFNNVFNYVILINYWFTTYYLKNIIYSIFLPVIPKLRPILLMIDLFWRSSSFIGLIHAMAPNTRAYTASITKMISYGYYMNWNNQHNFNH